MINRRSLITGLVSLVAAPAIVRAENLMKVRSLSPQVTVRIINGWHMTYTKNEFYDDDMAEVYRSFLDARREGSYFGLVTEMPRHIYQVNPISLIKPPPSAPSPETP